MRLIKLWDTSDQEIIIDMDRASTPLPYKKPNRFIELLINFALYLFTGRK